MVANHPGMTDQTSSNIARDGAAKKTPPKAAVHPGMSNSQNFPGFAPTNAGTGPDADPANVMSPQPKSKKSDPIPVKWGMKGEHDPALGSAVLSEAANLGR
jgi:hypothetical protein